MNLSGATTPGQCRPGSDVSERVLRIPKSSGNAWASPNPISRSLSSFPFVHRRNVLLDLI